MRLLLSVTWKDYDGEDGQEPPCHFYRAGLSKAAKQNKHTQTAVLCGMTLSRRTHALRKQSRMPLPPLRNGPG